MAFSFKAHILITKRNNDIANVELWIRSIQ